jgi:hypothetical protein
VKTPIGIVFCWGDDRKTSAYRNSFHESVQSSISRGMVLK